MKCNRVKKKSLVYTFQFLKETKILYEIFAFVSAFCFLGSYFLFYKPSLLCFIYSFNPGTAIFFILALVSSFVTVVLIIKERKVINETLLTFVIDRSLLLMFGILTRLGFIQYQRQGCGNILRWYVYFIDAFVATIILELVIILLLVFITNKAQFKQNKL